MQPYNRLLQHKLTNLEIADNFSDIAQLVIEEELTQKGMDYYYRSEDKKMSRLSDFAKEYIIENYLEECKSCDYPMCYLVDNIFNSSNTECGRIGIKIHAKEILNNKSKKYAEPTLAFKIENISKYNWVDVGAEALVCVPFGESIDEYTDFYDNFFLNFKS